MQHSDIVIGKNNYFRVSELGTKYDLSFSSYLRLSNKIIALDGVKRCLMVLETTHDKDRATIIDLNKMDSVSLKKSYGSIGPDQLHKKRMEEFLKTIELQFSNKNESTTVSFYDGEIDDPVHLPRLERNARNWQLILSKMVKRELNNVNE